MATRTGVTLKDVPAQEFIAAYAAHLKRGGKMELPEWVEIVKTSVRNELAPYDPDWYYVRSASIARRLYLRQGIGVGAFRKVYGGRKQKQVAQGHFTKASGSIIRSCLKELEGMKLIEKGPKGGRRITQEGQRDMDRIAQTIFASRGRLTVSQ